MITLNIAHVMVLCYGMLLPHHPFLTFETFSKKACRIEEIFVPLQCQMKEVAEATIKDKNCEH